MFDRGAASRTDPVGSRPTLSLWPKRLLERSGATEGDKNSAIMRFQSPMLLVRLAMSQDLSGDIL
jgi:hypothetical protein